MAKSFIIFVFISIILLSCTNHESHLKNQLTIRCCNRSSQIEIGGQYVGIEMHHSSPLLNRISFYYPVANSIDLSTDYWTRDQSRVLFLGLKIGDYPKEWIGFNGFEYDLTPFSVSFTKHDSAKSIDITYQFCHNKPAMIARFEVINNLKQSHSFEIYTHLKTLLRTCHTYSLKDIAWTEFNKIGATILVNYNDQETGNAQIFVSNTGELPVSFTTNGETVKDKNWWMNNSSELPGEIIDQSYPKRPVAAYIYRKNLKPKQKITITQIIGSCRFDEGREIVNYLLDNYKQEIKLYEDSVLEKTFHEGIIKTGDFSLDHSACWAKAILATNSHYLNGEIVPMPCPAEYNFFFTHDVLQTDLAAVNFDISRVKKDLEYIVQHANAEKIIPHAYYWKDDGYVTEYASPDNWNHAWFVLVSASYLRHSNDKKTLEGLFPRLKTSIDQLLLNKKDDDFIWGNRPDWWDIGKNFGPRSYLTILTTRAITDFVFICCALNKMSSELKYYEQLAIRMTEQLNKKLWSEQLNYLINFYEDGSLDPHYYIGALLAAHFNLLDQRKINALITTAQQYLLDQKLGIYNAYPMDFHNLIDYLKFSGNEAGDPFIYMNGGIWPHGNAWYAMALLSSGKKAETFHFIKNIMTIDGMMSSPNGQPAMYEYRNSNYQDSTAYGKIDKPQFLWAGGWCLYSLYHLLGVRENEWNIAFDPYVIQGQNTSRFSLYINGKAVTVRVAGSGKHIKYIKYDGTVYPSAVIPEELLLKKKIEIELGIPETPFVASTNSFLLSSSLKKRTLVVNVKAFNGHENKTCIISPWKPKSVLLNGVAQEEGWISTMTNQIYQIYFKFIHTLGQDELIVEF